MVTAGRWTRRLLGALSEDLSGFHAALAARRSHHPGLRIYQTNRSGRLRRFHLRTHDDGSAVLLVDVSDAIHLNPAAALLARCALERIPKNRAAATLRGRFGIRAEPSRAQAEKIYAMIERLATATGPCLTCGLTQIERSAYFSRPVSAPYKADLALSYRCNNACGHCYNRPCDRENVSVAERMTVAQWNDVLKRLAAIGIPYVIFTGGEPTLFEGLTDLVRRAARLGLVAGMNTNGRRLADRRFTQSLFAAGLDHVQVTLESCRPEVHNDMTAARSFDETLAGIRNALDVGLHTITNTTLTRRNIDHACQIVEFLHDLGLHTFAMNGMIHSGGGRANLDAVPAESLAPVLADVRDRAVELGMRFLWYTPTEYCRLSPVELELGPRRCNAGEYSICIEPNGDVLPCQSYYTPAGNILRDRWERIWNSKLFLGFRRRTVDPIGSGLPERCAACPDLALCGGGCRLEREAQENQTPDEETSCTSETKPC